MNTSTRWKVGDRVSIPGIGTGVVEGIRLDDREQPINTIIMDIPSDTASGYYVARDFELVSPFKESRFKFGFK